MATVASAGRAKGNHGGGAASVPAGPAVGLKRSAQAAFEGEYVHKIWPGFYRNFIPTVQLQPGPGDDG